MLYLILGEDERREGDVQVTGGKSVASRYGDSLFLALAGFGLIAGLKSASWGRVILLEKEGIARFTCRY